MTQEFEFVLTYKSGWKKVIKVPAEDRGAAWVQVPTLVSLKNVDIVALAVHWDENGEQVKQP